MSKVSMHAASAPMFVVMLKNLSTWLDKAETFATAKKIDMDVLLSSRLAPDMLPLRGQIALATAFAKNAVCRLVGDTPPDYPDTDVTLAQLRARITRTLDIVQSYPAAKFDGSDERQVTVGMGPEIKVTMSGADYLVKFVLPNFYFHMTTAYDILRHNGLELGKRDFLAGSVEIPNQ